MDSNTTECEPGTFLLAFSLKTGAIFAGFITLAGYMVCGMYWGIFSAEAKKVCGGDELITKVAVGSIKSQCINCAVMFVLNMFYLWAVIKEISIVYSVLTIWMATVFIWIVKQFGEMFVQLFILEPTLLDVSIFIFEIFVLLMMLYLEIVVYGYRREIEERDYDRRYNKQGNKKKPAFIQLSPRRK